MVEGKSVVNGGKPNVVERLGRWLEGRWGTFKYNFGWADWVWLNDSWLARAAVAVPVVGYLVLFNDAIASSLTFDQLTDGTGPWHLIAPPLRLRLIYVGLVLLAASSAIYMAFRPNVMRIGNSEERYIRRCMERFTYMEFQRLHHAIRGENHYTQYGKYYDADWDAFVVAALGPIVGDHGQRDPSKGNWKAAKDGHEALLMSILIETYFRESIKRRGWLSASIVVGLFGLLCLSIPSADLFVRVMWVVVTGGASAADGAQ